ncbi:AHH domain-containing protein [Cystobacter fuscus]|uniref:AHH domain-containing protein n=1 Tax=Cystobacter fuscus TaxID=43 RepID=UPI0037C05366
MTGSRFVSLKTLMQGSFELYGHTVADGRPNIHDFGPTPGSSGVMRRNAARKQQVQDTKERRKDKDNSAQESAGPHASSLVEYRAILGKGSYYARSAAKYIRANRASEYNDFPHLGPATFRAEVSAQAGLTQPSNFNTEFSGQKQPYLWQAHHMIPGEAFYTEDFNGQPIFDKPVNFDIVLQTPYDIDHGHNMIMLPGESWSVPVHALMQHPNNHNNYTQDVMQGLKRIDSGIDTLRGQNKPHETIVADVFQELKDLETELWELLLEESRTTVRGAAEGQRHDGPWCRWKTRGGKEYGGWPALW